MAVAVRQKKTADIQGLDDSDWLSLFSSRCVDDVPPGFRTVAELTAVLGKSETTTKRRLDALIKEGKVERRSFTTVAPGSGRLRPIAHYRIIEK